MDSEAFSTNENDNIGTRKRKCTRSMHPRNKYAENPPNFTFLASKYPSFREHVTYTPNGKSRIDWTDFNATRELTRVLLKHDYGIEWWIPDGQLCPTVPNRANYIHWIEDLLNNCPAPWHIHEDMQIWGLDIGTGANCIYPLLGASIHGWHFVGTDITDIAIMWARRNIQQNPHLTNLIEIRNAKDCKWASDEKSRISETSIDHSKSPESTCSLQGKVMGMDTGHGVGTEDKMKPMIEGCIPENVMNMVALVPPLDTKSEDVELLSMEEGSLNVGSKSQVKNSAMVFNFRCSETPVLSGVVSKGEKFDFCMCNPPFFENIEEAGANPHTSCGGTSEEMVYPGGEEGFISRIIEDSVRLKKQFHWFTTMVGRKVNLKVLIPKLRDKRVSMLRTTEFVQGRTSRWGLAWSFSPSQCGLSSPRIITDTKYISFMLQGLHQNFRAYDVLQALVQHLQEFGAACKVDISTFSFMGTLPVHKVERLGPIGPPQKQQRVLESDERPLSSANDHQFRVSVFEQAPGSLLIKGSLLDRKSSLSGTFSTMLSSAEQSLKKRFHMVQQR